MDLLKNIDNLLAKKRLHVVVETKGRGRLRPATIVMKRGTVIEADHVRVITHPEHGTQVVIFGIKPGIYPRWANRFQRIRAQRASLIGRMRDFTTPGRYIPCERCGQDETGWAEPDETGRYNAHRDYTWNNRFQRIMTAKMENVQDIRWRHESEAKMADEPDRFDYRGQKYRDFAGNPVAMLFEMGIPEVIFDRVLKELVYGVNATIAARSEYHGINQAVKLLALVFHPNEGQASAAWESGGQQGESLIPREMSFAELPSFLEEETSDYWNSP